MDEKEIDCKTLRANFIDMEATTLQDMKKMSELFNLRKQVKINDEKAVKWLSNGAQPTDTVKTLLVNNGVMEKFEASKK